MKTTWLHDKKGRRYYMNVPYWAMHIRYGRGLFELWNICETEASDEYEYYSKIFENRRLWVVQAIAEEICAAGIYGKPVYIGQQAKAAICQKPYMQS